MHKAVLFQFQHKIETFKDFVGINESLDYLFQLYIESILLDTYGLSYIPTVVFKNKTLYPSDKINKIDFDYSSSYYNNIVHEIFSDGLLKILENTIAEFFMHKHKEIYDILYIDYVIVNNNIMLIAGTYNQSKYNI